MNNEYDTLAGDEIREYLALDDATLTGYGLDRATLEYQLREIIGG
jgi:hypothetical protein